PSHTHIDFSNDLTYSEQFNAYTYRNFYNGGGVGLGDINNDGLLDIYFCGNQVNSKLYLNKGNLQFEDITEQAGVSCAGVWASGVAFVDINGDGFQDLYVCKSGKPGGNNRHNELFINQGKEGNFKFIESSKAYGLDNTGLSTHAAFFDYDRDGDLDCYLLNNSIRTVGAYDLRKDQRNVPDTLGGNKLMRNDSGHFVDVSKQAGIYSSAIGFGLGVSVGDLNGDTWPDLYVSNDFFERDYLYVNQHDGTFKESIESSMPEISLNSMGADMADINNDALPEVFVTDMLPETDARYKTKTTFENWEKYQRNVQNGYHHQFIRNALQLNRGNMKFSEISRYSGVYATDWSWGALIFDMNMDGYKDIFVANGIYKDLTDQDYLNLYNDPETIHGLMKTETNVIKKLIDAIPSERLPNYAFQNQLGLADRGSLAFINKSVTWGLSTPSFSNGSAYGDLDNDGDPDLVINNTGMPCFIYQNMSRELLQTAYLQFDLKGIGKNTKAIGTQITVYKSDQKYFQEIHPMRGFESCVDPRPLFGLGNKNEVDSIHILWPDGLLTRIGSTHTNQTITLSESESIKSVVFNKQNLSLSAITQPFNQHSLISPVTIKGLQYTHQENIFNDFERDRLLFNMISREGPAMAIGDVNGDHLEDVYIGHAMNSMPVLLLQRKDGSFESKKVNAFIADSASEDTDATFFDADQDGDLDLYVCSGGNEVPSVSSLLADRLYINNGKGDFTKSPQLLPTFKFESTSCVKPCDYDQDGDMDLFVGVRLTPFNYGLPCNGYILNNEKGIFKTIDVPDLINIGLITDATWVDLDGDKDQDLVICGDWMPVTVLLNDHGKFKNENLKYHLDQSHGLWQTICASDIDLDGDIDLIGGNWGLNSRIKSTAEKPVHLYINDYDQNGSAEQILTIYNGERAFPLTLRQDLIMQIPSLKKKYLKFENYKNQSITDIFTPDQLSHGLTLECKSTASTIFVQEHGIFIPKHLPFVAQLSPVFTILSKDLNDDRLPDLLLGGNFSASKPEIGSYMANPLTLLLQRKDHSFESTSINSSSTEVRAILPIKIRDKIYYLVANNNGSLEVLGPGK
ncbi:MAG: VCBS repeat-containing protein, partial [Saprospiraceae bacterium]